MCHEGHHWISNLCKMFNIFYILWQGWKRRNVFKIKNNKESWSLDDDYDDDDCYWKSCIHFGIRIQIWSTSNNTRIGIHQFNWYSAEMWCIHLSQIWNNGQNKYNPSPNLMVLSVGAEIEIKVKRNMKSSRNKSNSTFPQIWWSESATLQLWGRFQTLCDEPKWFFLAPQPFQCTWEGSSFISYKFGAQQVTLFGLYFFRITSQGVAALVSVSDGKIQITILILRRGALSTGPPLDPHVLLGSNLETVCASTSATAWFMLKPVQMLMLQRQSIWSKSSFHQHVRTWVLRQWQ